jgi:hypothetical protein
VILHSWSKTILYRVMFKDWIRGPIRYLDLAVEVLEVEKKM